LSLVANNANGDVRIYNRSATLAATWGASQSFTNVGTVAWGGGTALDSSTKVLMTDVAKTITVQLTFSGTAPIMSALAATSGTNYVCSTTTGLLTKSASACSGTEAEWIAAIPALTGDVQWLRQEVSRLAAQVAALGGGR
jgi:hypothetical protein